MECPARSFDGTKGVHGSAREKGFSNGCFLEHPTLSFSHIPVPRYLWASSAWLANFMLGKCWFAGSWFVEMCQLC